MLEMRERAARVVEIGVGHRRVLAHDVHALDLVGVHGVHDLDHGLAALRIELLAPGLFVFGDLLRVLHRLVVGEEHRDEAGVGGALHVVLAAQRMQAGAGTADLAADQRQRDQAARIVGAVGVLRHAHAPEDDGAFGARIGARHFAQRVGGNAADRRHFLRREVLDVFGERVEAFDISLDVLLVVELFADDDVEHGREVLHVIGKLLEAIDVSLHVLLVIELLADDDVEHAVEHGDVGAVAELHHAARRGA